MENSSSAAARTISRNSQRSKQAVSVKSRNDEGEGARDESGRPEHLSSQGAEPTGSQMRQGAVNRQMPSMIIKKQNKAGKKTTNSTLNSSEPKNIKSNLNSVLRSAGKKAGQSNQQLNVMSSTFINPMNGP